MPETGLAIGLDIDEKSIKFVKIKQTGSNITLLKYAIKDIPPTENRNREIFNVIKELFKGEKSDTEVYACAYGNNVSLKRLSIPVMPDNEIAEAIKWEAKNLVPFSIEKAAISYYKLGKTTDKNTEKLEIMFTVGGEELLNFFTTMTNETGIKLAGISILPLGLCSLLEMSKKFDGKANAVNAVIDIGADAASINLFKGNMLHFTREISVAGDSLTKAMTGLLVADHWQLNLTYDQAEEIKKRYGIPAKDTTETTEAGIPLIHIFEMMSPTLRRLQNEIIRSFDYYKEEFHVEKVDSIFLTGGSSTLKNLDDFLTNALGIKVEKINPFENLKIDPSVKIEANQAAEVAARLSLAIGLAIDRAGKINLWKTNDNKRSSFNLNLGSLSFLKNSVFKYVKIPVNLFAWLGVAAVIGAVSYNIYLVNERNHFREEVKVRQALLDDVKGLVERRLMLQQISKEETSIRETLSQITKALPSGAMLTDMIYDNSKKQVWLSGETSNTEMVGKVIKSFEDSPNFKSTVLIEARKSVVDGVPKILFKITFNLT